MVGLEVSVRRKRGVLHRSDDCASHHSSGHPHEKTLRLDQGSPPLWQGSLSIADGRMSSEPSTIYNIHRRVSRCPQPPSRTDGPGPRRTIMFDRAATNCIPQLPRPSAAMDLPSSRVAGVRRNRWTAYRNHWTTSSEYAASRNFQLRGPFPLDTPSIPCRARESLASGRSPAFRRTVPGDRPCQAAKSANATTVRPCSVGASAFAKRRSAVTRVPPMRWASARYTQS